MTTLALLALALLGTADASTNDVADAGLPELDAGSPDDGVQARGPGSSRPAAARPSTGGSRPAPSARPSSGPPRSGPPASAPRSSAPHASTVAPRPPASRPPASAPSARPPASRPPTAAPGARPPSARPPAPSARPPAPSARPPAARPPAARPPAPSARPPAARPPAARPAAPASRPGYRPPTTASRPGYRPPTAAARPGYRPVGPARPAYGVRGRAMYAGRPYYVRPYSGVFVYGPRPVYHSVYYVNGARPAQAVEVKERHMPDRAVDRDDTLAIGLKGGSYFGAYQGANAFADAGLGLVGRYRPAESVGLELGVSRHFDDERTHTTGSASVNLFAFPWSRVSPYVLAGGTFTDRDVVDTVWRDEQIQTISTAAPMMGAHAGLGLEVAIGQRFALDFEARTIGYLNHIDGDPTLPVAFTTGVGALWHF